MSWTLRIEHTDGTTDELELVDTDTLGDSNAPSLSRLRLGRELTPTPDRPGQDAEATVYRDAWSDVVDSIDRLNDEFYLVEDGSDEFGGRLRDFEFRGQLVSVLLDGPKRDALDAEPSGGNDVYDPQSDDGILTNEILPRMGTVSAGTISQQTASIPFSESQASPGKSVTKLAEATGAEVLYKPTGTPWELDYVGRLGSDRTGETLSPGDGLFGDPRVQEQTRENVTHVKVLGAQSGTAQVSSTAVASGYNSTTDRAVYRNHADKDIQQQGRADDLAQRFVDEYDGDPEFVEAEVLVEPSINPSLGDEFRVQIPKRNIDTDLRITNLRRILDMAGERIRCVFSNRKLTRDVHGDRQQRSIDEFREGNAGQYFFNSERVALTPIESSESLQFDISYPTDVVGDFGASLTIKSQPYRARVISQGHTHEVSIPGHNHALFLDDHNHDLSIGDHTHDVDITAPPHLHYLATDDRTDTNTSETSNPNNISGSVDDHTHTFGLDDDMLSTSTTTETSTAGGGTTTTTTDGGGITTTTSSGGSTTETTDEQGDLAPGVNEFSDEQVSNVTVTLNGNTIASGLSPPINETIDITGQLSGGDNAVEVTTDSLGEVEVVWLFEGIKNAG